MAKNLTFAFLVLLAALSVSYGQSSVPTDTVIKMHRFSEVFGVRPEYEVIVSADGTVTFKQIAVRSPDNPHPIVHEPVKSKISVATVAALVAEFERVKFFSLRDRYSRTEGDCPGGYMYDFIATEISMTVNGKTKTIFHDYGCIDKDRSTYPAELEALATEIDTLVNTKQWLK